jgi:hypothetical protein
MLSGSQGHRADEIYGADTLRGIVITSLVCAPFWLAVAVIVL